LTQIDILTPLFEEHNFALKAEIQDKV